jgi:hypothetical protein
VRSIVRSNGAVELHEIARLVLRSTLEVPELPMMFGIYGSFIGKQAKYEGKCPVVSNETKLRLTKDDTDLG